MDHIIDQWVLIENECSAMNHEIQKTWFRVVKRAAAAPNAQTGVERANSTLNRFKDKLSATMKIPMMQSRMRISENGPPVSKFNPTAVRHTWISDGQKYAQKISERYFVH